MNLKKAKALRKNARGFPASVNYKVWEAYEFSAVNKPRTTTLRDGMKFTNPRQVVLAPTCGKAIYRRLKAVKV